MNREELKKYIADTYDVDADFPWSKSPDSAVFRHVNNKKWFALVMEVPKVRLGLAGDGVMDIMNVKCEPIMMGAFRSEPGIYPAYHMNKENWLSVALDGSADDNKIKILLDMSFHLTANKIKKRSNQK